MISAANSSCAGSKSSLECLLDLAQSGALDHGVTVRASTDVFDLLNFSNCGAGCYARSPTLTPTNFSMYCWWFSGTVRYASSGGYAHLNVIAGLFGEIVVSPCVSGRLLPAWHLVVNHLRLVQDVEIRRVRVQFLSQTVSVFTIHHDLVGITDLSVDLVSDGDFDRFKSIQNVELQNVRAC